MNNKIFYILFIILAALFTGCDNDDVDKNNSIFDQSYIPPKNEFDLWLDKNFRAPYNTEIVYQFKFMESDFSYNLTPVTFERGTKFAQIIKYCWFECYDEVAGLKFTQSTVPKQIYFIGSQGLDPATQTEVLASAGGGLRVIIYKLNKLSDFSSESIVSYMHTMHHEFSHIMDQNKKIDPAFGIISEKDYIGDSWSNGMVYKENKDAYPDGFVSAYASSDPDEDYAEVYSRYLTMTDSEWKSMLSIAGEDGSSKIMQKVAIIRDYLKDEWNIDFDELRNSVQQRAAKAETLNFLTFEEFSVGNK